MQRGQRGLHADRRFLRVDPDRKIVQNDIHDVVPDLPGIVGVVRQRLIVRDQNVDLVERAGILQLHAPLQRADIMAEMQFAGRPIPR